MIVMKAVVNAFVAFTVLGTILPYLPEHAGSAAIGGAAGGGYRAIHQWLVHKERLMPNGFFTVLGGVLGGVWLYPYVAGLLSLPTPSFEISEVTRVGGGAFITGMALPHFVSYINALAKRGAEK